MNEIKFIRFQLLVAVEKALEEKFGLGYTVHNEGNNKASFIWRNWLNFSVRPSHLPKLVLTVSEAYKLVIS